MLEVEDFGGQLFMHTFTDTSFLSQAIPSSCAVQQKNRIWEETVGFFYLHVDVEGYARWTAI